MREAALGGEPHVMGFQEVGTLGSQLADMMLFSHRLQVYCSMA
jgi:hypothetical protein